MPPASATPVLPASNVSWASISAFMPEPHILFSVEHGVPRASPAPSTAWRAGAWPWPAASTQPSTASSTSSACRRARSTAARTRRGTEGSSVDVLEVAEEAAHRGADGADDDDRIFAGHGIFLLY